jgi:serine/threonine protein kinase
VVNEAGSQTAISVPGGFAGTPEFASPEQFAGVGADIRSDLYSLGVALWEMVTGHVLFRGSPSHKVMLLGRTQGWKAKLNAGLASVRGLVKDARPNACGSGRQNR